jgi:hypothetical protein
MALRKFNERNEARTPKTRKDRVELDYRGRAQYIAGFYGCPVDNFLEPDELYLDLGDGSMDFAQGLSRRLAHEEC